MGYQRELLVLTQALLEIALQSLHLGLAGLAAPHRPHLAPDGVAAPAGHDAGRLDHLSVGGDDAESLGAERDSLRLPHVIGVDGVAEDVVERRAELVLTRLHEVEYPVGIKRRSGLM